MMALKNNAGFTMIEAIVTMALIGILGGIAVVLLGRPGTSLAVAEAEALKANLRFTQSRAMCDLPGNLWSLNISGSGYTIQRNGGVPNPAVSLPGSNSATYSLPAGLAITAGTGQTRFNFRGQPVDASANPLAANGTITLSGVAVTVTRETGFIP
jgi:prepilin-type N-terminal cleavage/methylation domain-containing protein